MSKLNEKALLVNVSISEWNGKRFDREITEEIDAQHNTNRAGIYTKYLIDIGHLAPIVSQRAKIRSFHIKNTLPWGNDGDRLLPAARYIEYVKGMDELTNQFNELVRDFVSNYPTYKAEGRRNLKDLFKESDYPTETELHQRFGVRIIKNMLPETGDFRLELNDEMVDNIRQEIQTEVDNRHVKAIEDIMHRIHTAVKRVVETLSKESATFRNSMIENIESLIEIIPSLNYTGDSKINLIVKDLENLIVDPDHIRKDGDIKNTILERAKKLEQTYF